MAKEAKGIVSEEQREGRATDLVRATFFEATPFIQVFEDVGISVSPGESMGVANAALFTQILELSGIRDKDERRKIATTATGQIVRARRNPRDKNLLENVLAMGDIRIGVLDDEKTTFYYRSDLSLSGARQRYTTMKDFFEDAKKPEEKRPSTVTFIILSYHKDAPQDVKDRDIVVMREQIAELDQGSDNSGRKKPSVVEILPDPTEEIPDKSARLISEADIESIFQRGISEAELGHLLSGIRNEFVKEARQIEASAGQVAEGLYLSTKDAVEKPGKNIYRAVFANRGIAPALMWQVLARGDDQIGVRVNISDYDYPPYTNFLLQIWHERHIMQNLIEHKSSLRARAAKGDAVALFLDSASEDETTWSSAVKKLVLDGSIDVDGDLITQEDVDDVLAPLILRDDFILKAVFADLVGAILPVAYGLTGELREQAFGSIHAIVDQFSVSEIIELIKPVAPQKVIKTVMGLQDPVASRIHEAIMQRVPSQNPNPNDYEGGNSAKMYRVMQARRGRNGHLPQPNPEDYRGQDSKAFKLADSLFNAYQILSPSNWGIKATSGKRLVMVEEPESLISERLRR